MCSVFVLVRPGAKEFLENLAPFYEMVIYTASLSKYADPLMDMLDPKGLCTARLFREHCTFYDRIFVKDLSKIDRDPKDLLILDNSPNSYLFQPESALPIVSWYEDMEDTLLYDYVPILQGLSIVDDVRDALAAFVYPNEPMEYDRVDIDKGLEILDQYIAKAREQLVPEYESKHKNRIFSEPRNFQRTHLEEDQEEFVGNKTFGAEPPVYHLHNSAIVKPSTKFSRDMINFTTGDQDNKNQGTYNLESSLPSATNDFSSPLMNTWTNNKFANNRDANLEVKKKKPNSRPRSGSPSPTKMDTGVERYNQPRGTNNYNTKPNPIYVHKQQFPVNSNEAVILRSYSNTKQNITPVSIQSQLQSNNPPQPHQRHIKRGIMSGNKNTNLQNDMYRIYGINKSDINATHIVPTPKTSSGKRDSTVATNSFGIRGNNPVTSTRINQTAGPGNRSVSPNRIVAPDISGDQEMFAPQRPNVVDMLKFQARTNLTNMEKDMAAMIGKHKKMLK